MTKSGAGLLDFLCFKFVQCIHYTYILFLNTRQGRFENLSDHTYIKPYKNKIL